MDARTQTNSSLLSKGQQQIADYNKMMQQWRHQQYLLMLKRTRG